MNADQLAKAIRQLEAVYRDAGDNSKATGLQAFANLLSESPGVGVAQWCDRIATKPKGKKPAKRSKAKA